MPEIHQDLLLAALAQLVDTVPEEVLRSALSRWSQDPERSLAEHLEATGELDSTQIRALQAIVTAHLEKHQNDLRRSLSAWNADRLPHDVLTEVDAGTGASPLAATIATLLSEPPGSTVNLAAAPADGVQGSDAELPSFTLSERFRLLRKHARGGIGEVWLAQDRELQREVAVKEIQARYVDRRDQRKRFLLEAEITGSLEHPGIVPVYSLGRNEQGRPYYAMRFIRGESLSSAIQRFHEERRKVLTAGARGRTPWGVEFQQLLRRFLDVCDAMEYAHSRKVIHRDLKPANIMLGAYGETLVVDWGLAKILGGTEASIGTNDEASDARAAGPPTPEEGTQFGSTIGTPAYMSPEQARGEVDRLGPASDVYSLGATLYELLTGVMPFKADTVPEILARVLTGALIPPRSLVADLPAPLEAICLKAMAREPEARYASARELAGDLEHWMADEPVAAYPETRLQRAARWLRRHRAWTYAGAVTLLGVTLAATVALFLVDGARRREEDARQQAERNFRMAQQAVDEYLTRVSENTLLREQETTDLRKLRQDLLRSALPFYQSFVEQSRDDPAAREQLANAYFRLGAITEVIQATDEALRLYRSSVALWEPLVTAQPENLGFRHRLADCHFAIGRLLREQDHRKALSWLSTALRAYESLSEKDPADPVYQASIANCYSELGLCYSYDEDLPRALETLGKGRAVQEKLVRRQPEDVDLLKTLAEIVNRMGFVAYKRHDYAAALGIYQEFQGICLDILAKLQSGPQPLKILESLGRSYYNIGSMRLEQGENQAALVALEKARDTYSALVRDHSTVNSYQQSLGQSHLSIATAHFRLQAYEPAMSSLALAAIRFDRLIRAEPDNLSYLRDKGLLLDLTGAVLDAQRENVKAEPYFRESLDLRRAIVRKPAGGDADRDSLCLSLTNLGENTLDQGRPEEGLPLYLEALQLRGELVSSNPGDTVHLAAFAELAALVSEIQNQSGRVEAAVKTVQDARAVVERVLKAGSTDRGPEAALSRLLLCEASARVDLPEQAALLLRQVIDRNRTLLEANPEDPTPRGQLTEAFRELARIRRDQGSSAEADRLEADRRSLWTGRPLDPLIALAAQQSVRAQLIGYGRTPLPAAGEAARRRALDRAVASLRLALESGFKDLARIKADPDLSPLLGRGDLAPLPEASPAAPR
jgi:serine/threonine-protein kinase